MCTLVSCIPPCGSTCIRKTHAHLAPCHPCHPLDLRVMHMYKITILRKMS